MKLLDIITLGISFLSVVVSIVALVISKRQEKVDKADLLKREENAKKEHLRRSVCEMPPDYQALRKKMFARSRKYALRGAIAYKRTGQNRAVEVIKGSASNNAHEAYRQMLVTYLKKLYPETEEECILLMSDELQKSETDGLAESLAIRAEKAKERITALGKGIPE